MGGMLTQPVTQKSSDQGKGLGLRYGLSTMQGWRPEMEDAHDVKLGLRYGLDDWSFFAVFDGHAGKCAAAFAAWNLLDFILRDSQFELTDDSQDSEALPNNPNPTKPVESTPNPSTEKSNGGEGTTNSIDQTINSDDHKTNSEPSKLSENATPEATTGKQSDSCTDEKSNEEVPKSKFASFPVLKQLDMVKNAIKSGFLRIDQNMRVSAQDTSGCTAVCALISPTHYFIANCGDSRAVLYDGVNPTFVTEDHKPSNPKERKRIIEAGGTATQRINGTLAVSRALGDFEFKKDNHRGQCEQLVSPEPEVTVIERHPHDQFLVLACDGIWDVMENDDLCHFIRHQLMIEPDLEKVCSSVLDVCLHKGSRDNMSIILVVFDVEPKINAGEVARDKSNDEVLLRLADALQERDKLSNTMDFPAFLHCLKVEIGSSSNFLLPPGAGIEAKYDLLRERFERNAEKYKEHEQHE